MTKHGAVCPSCNEHVSGPPNVYGMLKCVWCGSAWEAFDDEPEEAPDPKAIPAPMLGQDAAEAQRLAFGGRRIDLLKESREFDSSRLEANGLFPPKQRGMFGE